MQFIINFKLVKFLIIESMKKVKFDFQNGQNKKVNRKDNKSFKRNLEKAFKKRVPTGTL